MVPYTGRSPTASGTVQPCIQGFPTALPRALHFFFLIFNAKHV